VNRIVVGIQTHHSVQLDDAVRGLANASAGLRGAYKLTDSSGCCICWTSSARWRARSGRSVTRRARDSSHFRTPTQSASSAAVTAWSRGRMRSRTGSCPGAHAMTCACTGSAWILGRTGCATATACGHSARATQAADNSRTMKYRHERMVRARDERIRRRLQQEVAAALRDSLTDDEARLWQMLSDAVGRVRVE
jgi:hypothetical protein